MNWLQSIQTTEDFNRVTDEIMQREGYRKPQAFAIGSMYCGAEGKPLAVYFPHVNMKEHDRTAALFQEVTKWSSLKTAEDAPSFVASIEKRQLDDLLQAYKPFDGDGKVHANINAVKMVRAMAGRARLGGGKQQAVIVCIYDLNAPPTSLQEIYLRLCLLSTRKTPPNSINLDNVFGMLPICAWTQDDGPVDMEDFDRVNMEYILQHGKPLRVDSIDKFPRITDFVVPSGVRVAHADNIRLGAHLAPGTVVMHAGTVNFNSGTLGKSMIEGRISAGVVIGENSDVGGGASTMGVLSGGGKERVSVGEHCLIGAQGGIGISLGNYCKTEAGLYITIHTDIEMPDGTTVKAIELSGRDGMTFYRDGGRVKMVRTKGAPMLNEALH